MSEPITIDDVKRLLKNGMNNYDAAMSVVEFYKELDGQPFSFHHQAELRKLTDIVFLNVEKSLSNCVVCWNQGYQVAIVIPDKNGIINAEAIESRNYRQLVHLKQIQIARLSLLNDLSKLESLTDVLEKYRLIDISLNAALEDDRMDRFLKADIVALSDQCLKWS